jgi:hypothetical protein
MKNKMRPLTEGEKAMLKPCFGMRIDYEGVRLCHGHRYHPIPIVALKMPNTDAVTIEKTIYFDNRYVEDFSADGIDRESPALLFHEMTHVYQWALLGRVGFLARYAKEFLSVRMKSAAMYDYERAAGEPPLHFNEARLEAQAAMIQDYARFHLARDAAGMQSKAVHLARTHFFGL